jgi:hypothetical protein
MRLRHVYLLLFAVGTVLPLSRFVPWVADNGLNIRSFFTELFSTQIGSFFGLDVIVSAVVLTVFVVHESLRIKMSGRWLILTAVLVVTILAGVSSGFPLFLYLRQEHIDNL